MVSLGPVSVLCVVCRGCVVCERACAMRGCVRAAERGVDHLGWVSCANSRTPQGAPGAPGVLVRRSKSIGSPYALLSPLSLRPHCGRPGGGGRAGRAHLRGRGSGTVHTPLFFCPHVVQSPRGPASHTCPLSAGQAGSGVQSREKSTAHTHAPAHDPPPSWLRLLFRQDFLLRGCNSQPWVRVQLHLPGDPSLHPLRLRSLGLGGVTRHQA